MKWYGLSDIGSVRSENQDSFGHFEKNGFFSVTVCDGMGGAAAGALASEIAVSVFNSELEERIEDSKNVEDAVFALNASAMAANRAVYKKSLEGTEFSGMGTTLVSALSDGETTFIINVGDSRGYALKNGELSQVTKDHSLVQFYVDRNLITEEEAAVHPERNIITRAIGIDKTVKADVYPVWDFDMLLLCSDGLSGVLTLNEMKEAILSVPVEDAPSLLIKMANEKGGPDNITAVVIVNDRS